MRRYPNRRYTKRTYPSSRDFKRKNINGLPPILAYPIMISMVLALCYNIQQTVFKEPFDLNYRETTIKSETENLTSHDILEHINTKKVLTRPSLNNLISIERNKPLKLLPDTGSSNDRNNNNTTDNSNNSNNSNNTTDNSNNSNNNNNTDDNISDIRKSIVALANKYLNAQTEHGRVGYSMYEFKNSGTNSKGHNIGRRQNGGGNYIRLQFFEPEGAGDSKFWLDCSSFVGIIYNELGIKRNDGLVYPKSYTTVDWAKSGTRISYEQLQPGDILVISGSHVGIYAGGDLIIHCTGTGKKDHADHVKQVKDDYHQIKTASLEKWKTQGYNAVRPAGLPN